MLTSILVAALALGTPLQAADTVIAVDRGVRLEVDNFRGEVIVRSWDRDAVRVEADLSGERRLDVVRSGSALRVRPAGGHGPREADFEIAVPRWMAVRIEGNQVDVRVEGTRGEVSVETVGGDVSVEGGAGLVSVRSIQGEITVRGTRGRVEAMSVNEEVSLTAITGDIYVETTNGDVTIRETRSSAARATTVNGDVVYEGSIEEDGRYVFSTHNGDVSVTIPDNAGATVSVSTYHGEFESEFPVRLTGTTRDRQFTFTLGSGSARIELESFNGEIQLRRP
jgi:hypothetical protein